MFPTRLLFIFDIQDNRYYNVENLCLSTTTYAIASESQKLFPNLFTPMSDQIRILPTVLIQFRQKGVAKNKTYQLVDIV